LSHEFKLLCISSASSAGHIVGKADIDPLLYSFIDRYAKSYRSKPDAFVRYDAGVTANRRGLENSHRLRCRALAAYLCPE